MPHYVKDPGAIDAIQAEFDRGTLDPVILLEQTLQRCRDAEPAVAAWRALDEAGAARQAQARARELAAGRRRSALHGIPVAIKDVIDVAGMPTRAGSLSRAQVPPAPADAEIVAALRAAGAVILGKVHTTEFAYFDGPPPTRNPWHTAHTPGGSSGGPAAAVAAGMVACSIGTQTAGSVVRPAAYCGIAAFKPTSQNGSTFGIVPLAPAFDTPGWFGHRCSDVVAMSQAIHPLRYRPADTPTPRIGVVDDALFGDMHADARADLDRAAARLAAAGYAVEKAMPATPLQALLDDHRIVLEHELARVHGGTLAMAPAGQVTPAVLAAIERGRRIDEDAHARARAALAAAQDSCWDAWSSYDVLLAPAAPGSAPAGMATGDPRYIIPFTALGGPIVTLPTGQDRAGMPLGTMLMARPGADARLLAQALRLAAAIEQPRDWQPATPA